MKIIDFEKHRDFIQSIGFCVDVFLTTLQDLHFCSNKTKVWSLSGIFTVPVKSVSFIKLMLPKHQFLSSAYYCATCCKTKYERMLTHRQLTLSLYFREKHMRTTAAFSTASAILWRVLPPISSTSIHTLYPRCSKWSLSWKINVEWTGIEKITRNHFSRKQAEDRKKSVCYY